MIQRLTESANICYYGTVKRRAVFCGIVCLKNILAIFFRNLYIDFNEEWFFLASFERLSGRSSLYREE